MAIAHENEVPAQDIGVVGGDNLIVHVNEHPTIDVPVAALFDQWSGSLESKLSA